MISRDKRKTKNDCFPNFKQIIVTIIIVAMLLFANTFLFKIIIVDGFSMYPTLENGRIVLVELADESVAYGDIVVFNTEYLFDFREFWIKRVIGVGGDTVEINYDTDTVTVNGRHLEEPYINYEENDPMADVYNTGTVVYIVPKNCIFVMGDNRNYSSDSRCPDVGVIPQNCVIGKVVGK